MASFYGDDGETPGSNMTENPLTAQGFKSHTFHILRIYQVKADWTYAFKLWNWSSLVLCSPNVNTFVFFNVVTPLSLHCNMRAADREGKMRQY